MCVRACVRACVCVCVCVCVIINVSHYIGFMKVGGEEGGGQSRVLGM